MKREFYCCFLVGLAAFFLSVWMAPSANAQRILFHGADVGATFGDDGLVLSHLETRYGATNVMYMQGDMAAADGSSANGFDAVIISSTLGSGTIRDKYEDSPLPVLNWEQALTRQMVGEFNLSSGGRTLDTQTDITILDSSHPIATGFSGDVTVFTTPHTMSLGTGTVAPGVARIATTTADPANDHAILAAEAGAQLLGDGSVGSPTTAPARRVMFFLEDEGFGDLTPAGLQLFDNAVDWMLGDIMPIIEGDFNDDGVVDDMDYDILVNNLGGHLDGMVDRSNGDINFDGKVDLDDFGKFKELFPGALGQAAAIPEPASVGLLASTLVMLALARLVSQRRRVA